LVTQAVDHCSLAPTIILALAQGALPIFIFLYLYIVVSSKTRQNAGAGLQIHSSRPALLTNAFSPFSAPCSLSSLLFSAVIQSLGKCGTIWDKPL